MIPPTPTLIPDAVGQGIRAASQTLNLDSGIGSLWNRAPEVVGLWNQFADYTPALQWIVFGVIILGLLFVVLRKLKAFSEDTHD